MTDYTKFFLIYKRKYYKYNKDQLSKFGAPLDYGFIEFVGMIHNMPCFYCGKRVILGLDRKNNDYGHEKANVLPCCRTCNSIRMNTFSVEEAFIIIQTAKQFYRVVEYEKFDISFIDKEIKKIQERKRVRMPELKVLFS